MTCMMIFIAAPLSIIFGMGGDEDWPVYIISSVFSAFWLVKMMINMSMDISYMIIWGCDISLFALIALNVILSSVALTMAIKSRVKIRGD